MTLIEHNDAPSPGEHTNLPSVEVVPSGEDLLTNFVVAHTKALAKGMPDFKEAVKWLAVAQIAYNYTQKEMAAKTGVAQSTISQYLKWHRKGCPDAGPFVRRVTKPRTGGPQPQTNTVIDAECTVVDESKLVNGHEQKLVDGPEPEPDYYSIDTTCSIDDIVTWVRTHVASKHDLLQVIDQLDSIYNDEPDDHDGNDKEHHDNGDEEHHDDGAEEHHDNGDEEHHDEDAGDGDTGDDDAGDEDTDDDDAGEDKDEVQASAEAMKKKHADADAGDNLTIPVPKEEGEVT